MARMFASFVGEITGSRWSGGEEGDGAMVARVARRRQSVSDRVGERAHAALRGAIGATAGSGRFVAAVGAGRRGSCRAGLLG